MTGELGKRISPVVFLVFGIIDLGVGLFLINLSLGGIVGNSLSVYAGILIAALLGITFFRYTDTNISGSLKIVGILGLSVLGLFAVLKVVSSPDIMKLIGIIMLGKGAGTITHYSTLKRKYKE